MDKRKYPEVFINSMWYPICGHWFWDNNIGATLFCRKLNPECRSGFVSRKNVRLNKKAVRVGKCNGNDQWLKCKGGCNGNGMGNARCQWRRGWFSGWNVAKCSRGDPSGIEITCKPNLCFDK